MSDAPVAIVHYWERHKDAEKGCGAVCLEEALRICDEMMNDDLWTCFVDVVPSQWTTARREIGGSHALVMELQAAEMAIFGIPEKMSEESSRLPPEVMVIWRSSTSFTRDPEAEDF